MNSLLKKGLAINLAVLVLLLPLLTAAQKPIPRTGKVFLGYGVEPDVMPIPNKLRPRSTIPPRTSVQQILKSHRVFREAGGIMFDQVGSPCNALSNDQLRLSYNDQQPDGRRLTLHVGNRAYSVAGMRDNDLEPIAKFVDSESAIVANVQYPDPAISQSCPVPSRKLQVVRLNPAFENRQLGWLMTRMDYIPWSILDGLRWDDGKPLPNEVSGLSRSLGESLLDDKADYRQNVWPSTRAALFNAGAPVLDTMTPQERKQYSNLVNSRTRQDWEKDEAEVLQSGVDMAVWRKLSVEERRILLLMIEPFRYESISNINDDKAPPTFCTQASTVRLGGLPNVQFIVLARPQNFVLPTSSSLMTQNLPKLRLVDQDAYDGMVRIYRLGGLFRYVKNQSPFHWKQFLKTLPQAEEQDTYAILCPSCPPDAVRKWVACVDKNFPS